jgi:alpha-glucosidase
MCNPRCLFVYVLLSLSLLLINCQLLHSQDSVKILSPDELNQVTFQLIDGAPFYQLSRNGQVLIEPSRMGFILRNEQPLSTHFRILKTEKRNFQETWEQVWGEEKLILNHYNEMRIELVEDQPNPRKLYLIFRMYNDGLGFRYEIPEQDHLHDFQIMDELTEFVLAEDYEVWWIPVYKYHRYEYLFQKSPASQIDTVHTPLTMKTPSGIYLSIHEANLTDYAAMTLLGSQNQVLKCDLIPWSDGVKVKTTAPMQTPWRTIQIAEQAGDLIQSHLILNLNEPNRIQDVSWIKPGKYVGIWWGMHLGTYTWGSGPKHGATTANAKKYIDFAAKNGFYGVLIEGWNVDWDGTWWENGEIFNFTKPHPDYDIVEVTRYAATNGVKIIGHHETGAHIGNYEQQLEAAFKYFKEFGIDAIKTGYVGQDVISTEGIREWHHGQYMVRHYRRVVELAAKYHIMLDVHEPIKDTGIRRTWPNMMTREGARGQEYNAWAEDGGNPVDYFTIIPFTRMLAGPFDYTPGIFDLEFKHAGRPNNRVRGTLAKELAIYVVIYSPLHMAADLIENYQNQPAFKFIKDVPVDWEFTKVLNGNIGEYITIARKDRHSSDWYVGSITNEDSRVLEVPLSFLNEGTKYVAEIYADAKNSHWENNPLAIAIQQVIVDRDSILKLNLAAGGGQAIRLSPTYEDHLLKKNEN